jgi:hypothetical protein
MKVLFVGPTSPDHLMSCLWDGMQEVLGEANVFDGVGNPTLHTSTCESSEGGDRCLGSFNILHKLGGEQRLGRRHQQGERYDLVVVHSSYNRDYGPGWLAGHPSLPGAKIAYVEGWDAAWQIVPPEIIPDAVFRKEIDPTVSYPYQPQHLTFAAPTHWHVQPSQERPWDVVFIGNPDSAHPGNLEMRWKMCARVFATKRHHKAVVASRGLGFDAYFQLLRSSRLALCPAAADGSDSLRTYEAAACGAIPVFVGYPDYRRADWFDQETAIFCTPDSLADQIDDALSSPKLESMRRRMIENAKRNHTTKARALKVLKALGFDGAIG